MSKFAHLHEMVLCKQAATVVSCHLNLKFVLSFILGGCPVYHGNSYNGPVLKDCTAYLEHGTFVSGVIGRHRSVKEDDYSQARIFYTVCFCSTSFLFHCCYVDFLQEVLTDQKREILINNITAALAECTDKNIINRSLAVLSNVDEDLESKIKKNLQSYLY